MTRKRKCSGRPKLPKNQLRSHSLCVRVSLAELSIIRRASAQLHISIGEYIRMRAVGYRTPSPPLPQINIDKYAELARLAGNFNQLAHNSNCGKPVIVDIALLQNCLTELRGLRQGLLGISHTEVDVP